MKILLTGGGTHGHVIPLLAVVSEIKSQAAKQGMEKPQFLLVSPDKELGKQISGEDITIMAIKAGKLRRYFSWKNISDAFKVPVGISQSYAIVSKFKPDVVFSKGGFASVPPVVAASLLRVPIITHESDIVPGLANRIISKLAAEIFVSYPETKKCFPNKKVQVSGNPIRENIIKGDKEYAKRYFNLHEGLPTILVFGGSQGARKINDTILESLGELLEKFQVIHVCGKKNYAEAKTKFEKRSLRNEERYKLYPYLANEMKEAYAVADVIVSRAGANSLAEIIALGKPGIVIPLSSSAGNHQLKNAKYFAQRRAIVLLEEKDLNSDNLKNALAELLLNKNREQEIRKNIAAYNKSVNQNAARLIAEEILKFSNTKG